MPRHAPYLDSVDEALSIKYNNRVYELKSAGEDVIVLSLGEAYFDLPLHSFASLPKPALFHYSHSRGLPELRQQLAEYYSGEYGVPVDPQSELLITAGSKIGIHMSLMALLSPQDSVIIHEPAWVSYSEQVKLCHGVPIMVPHTEPLSKLPDYVKPRTKAIIVNNPNNPRGSVLTRKEIETLYRAARDRDLYLIVDEAYSDFLIDNSEFYSFGRVDTAKDHVILCNSLSKNFGMSGWRLGYVISNGKLIQQLLKINQHLVTCPATILEYYLVQYFSDLKAVTKPQIAEVVQKRKKVAKYLDKVGLHYLPGNATFYFFVSIQGTSLTSDEFCTRLLNEHKVCAVPGSGYGPSCDGFIRVSIGTESLERIFHGIDKVQALVGATKKARRAA